MLLCSDYGANERFIGEPDSWLCDCSYIFLMYHGAHEYAPGRVQVSSYPFALFFLGSVQIESLFTITFYLLDTGKLPVFKFLSSTPSIWLMAFIRYIIIIRNLIYLLHTLLH